MKKLGLVVLSLYVGGVALAGCSKSLTRDDVKAEITKTSIPSQNVDCVTDKMIAKFGLDKLSSNGSLSAEETAAVTQITIECVSATTPTSTTATP